MTMMLARIFKKCPVTIQNVIRRYQSAQASLLESSIESMRNESIFTEDHIALRQSLRKVRALLYPEAYREFIDMPSV